MISREEIEKLALEKYPVYKQSFKSQIGDFYEIVDCNKRPRQAFLEAYDLLLKDVKISVEKAREEAKKSVLKDLPKWKKADRDINSDVIDYAVMYTHDGGDYSDYQSVALTNRVFKDEMYFELSDLEKLL